MKISLAEGLYLIALDDEEGRLLAAAEKKIIPGLISASLLELHLLKKIRIGANQVISVEDSTGTGNGIMDKILSKVKSGTSFLDTVDHLSEHFKDILEDLNELLIQRGILKKEATKLMWIPLSERMDNANYAFEQEIRNGMHAIVFKQAKPSVSYVVLMSLIYDCGILEEVFKDKDELIDAVKVAKDIVKSPSVSQEVSGVLVELKKYFGH